MVEAVHVDLQRAENAGEPRAVLHLHLMHRRAAGPALERRLTVIERRARRARNVLMEAAAEGDVEHLEAAADREQGSARLDRPAGQLDLEPVARRGDVGGGRVRRLAEPGRIDVAASRQQHTVQPLQELGARRGLELRR